MPKDELVIIADYSNQNPLTLEELCEACGIRIDIINELISHDIVTPFGESQDEWVFDLVQLQRAKKALRLQQDFEINLAGIALILDLLDELEELRAHEALLTKMTLRIP